MRRVLPWALVGLVVVAGLVGALVGVTNQPSVSARLRLSAIDAATRVAGTARFAYSAITSSPNPLLRSTSYGRGRVDFATESLRTVEDDRQTSLESSDGGPSLPTTQTTVNSQIWIGDTNYESFNPVGSGSDDSWTKDGSSPVASGLGTFGIFSNVDPISTLAADAAAPGDDGESWIRDGGHDHDDQIPIDCPDMQRRRSWAPTDCSRPNGPLDRWAESIGSGEKCGQHHGAESVDVAEEHPEELPRLQEPCGTRPLCRSVDNDQHGQTV